MVLFPLWLSPSFPFYVKTKFIHAKRSRNRTGVFFPGDLITTFVLEKTG